jgi:hypothetical protein
MLTHAHISLLTGLAESKGISCAINIAPLEGLEPKAFSGGGVLSPRKKHAIAFPPIMRQSRNHLRHQFRNQ